MTIAFLISILIAVIIAGFVLWAGRLLASCIPMDPLIAKVVDTVIVIIAVVVILFYVVIPLGDVSLDLPNTRDSVR